MIMINLKGGLGNQMFQYSLYTKMQLCNKNVFLDTIQIKSEMDMINRGTIFETFELDKKYSMESFNKNLFYKKVRRKYCKKILGTVKEKEGGRYYPEILEISKGYIDGYWQSYKYFSDIREVLLKRFQFKTLLKGENLHIYNQIMMEQCPVSLHIRLGDYVSKTDFKKLYGGICTERYYQKAIDVIMEMYDSPTFYIFSNDLQQALKLLPDLNYTVVKTNDEKTAWADMLLMKTCKHNIIANSSFSWWGAWLNSYNNKTVIAPEKFINGMSMPDICPNEWIRI